MSRYRLTGRVAAAVIVVTASVAAGPVVAGAAGAGALAAAREPVTRSAVLPAGQGSQLWVQRYNGPGNGNDVATAVAVSPVRPVVFVTGGSEGVTSGADFATVAYNAVTGAQLWARRYNGPANGDDVATAVAVSPDGKRVFVTGGSSRPDYATVAYNAVTGAQLWARRYNGPRGGTPSGLAVSPDGREVFVTGASTLNRRSSGYATVAYNAATGAQLWAQTVDGRNYPVRGPVSVAASTGRVFVTTRFYVSARTVAYSATTGARLWARRYNGGSTSGAAAVAVGPNGKTVYVSGFGGGVRTHANFATIAYNAATGARRWVSHFNGPGPSAGAGPVIAISPRGHIVYVTGTIRIGSSGSDYATVAYHAATGTQIWARLYNGIIPGSVNIAAAIATSRVAPEVVVTGSSDGINRVDYATVAYNTGTGVQLWATRYNGPGGTDFARAIAISRTGTIYVTGESQGTTTGLDYATIAYQG